MASLNHPLSPRLGKWATRRRSRKQENCGLSARLEAQESRGGVSDLNPSWHHARTLNACPVCPACPACPRRRSCSSGGQAIAALRLHLIRDAGPVDEISPMGTRDLGVKRDDFACLWGRRVRLGCNKEAAFSLPP